MPHSIFFNVKFEGQPFFELVHGEWMTDVTGLTTDAQGSADTQALTRGAYTLTVEDGEGGTLTKDFEIVTAFARLVADLGTNDAYLLGDLNGDDTLDFADVEAFALALEDATAYEDAFGLDPLQRGDLDGNGQLDNADARLFADFFGQDQSADVLALVPEPTTAALLLTLTALTSRRRRHTPSVSYASKV
ncbi:MAG: PEP-CTERM sorting domain-containing protein [Planctomycetota bacterium]